jgi:rod shape-determining protein MreD
MNTLISQQPTHLLPPPNPLYMGFTLWLGFLLNMLPATDILGVLNIFPIILVFWNIHYPRQVGIGIAFLFGVLMDIQFGFLLGHHALTYTLLTYTTIALRRRFLWFGYREQILQLFVLLLIHQLIFALILLLMENARIGWHTLTQPFIQSILWPLVVYILQWPQRRNSKSEANRHR